MKRLVGRMLALPLPLLLSAASAHGQESPAKRVGATVGVAVKEYAKGVDALGRITSTVELEEATGPDPLPGIAGELRRVARARCSSSVERRPVPGVERTTLGVERATLGVGRTTLRRSSPNWSSSSLTAYAKVRGPSERRATSARQSGRGIIGAPRGSPR